MPLLVQGELSLGQLQVMDFQQMQQLTLSACETAFGGGRNENGAEVEALAAVVLRQRAQAVRASLWKEDDASTAQLMRDYYAAHSSQDPLSRAQALRQAQLRMLRGSSQPSGTMPTAKPNPAWTALPLGSVRSQWELVVSRTPATNPKRAGNVPYPAG